MTGKTIREDKMSNTLHRNLRRRIAFVFFLIVMSTASCIPIPLVPPDTVLEGITLAEAQRLLPFGVCLPTYLPPGIVMSDTVRYHDEFGDPNESDITIDYYVPGNQDPVVTIYERHGPGRGIDAYDSSTRSVSLRDLIIWQVGWLPADDWSKLQELQSQVDVRYEVYTLDSDRLIVEIQSPESLRAVQITWYLKEFVLIDVYSRLSVEETKSIANSVTDCASLPISTP